MTDLGPLGCRDAGLCLGLVGPSVSTPALADAWLERDDSSIVLTGRHHRPCRRYQSTVSHADRQLDARGWTVPAPIVGAGHHLGEPGDATADDWFEHFQRTHPEHADFVQTVRSPTNVVGSLETLLADLVIPTPDGLTAWGRQRIGGNNAAITRRGDAIVSRVQAFDIEEFTAARPSNIDRRIVCDALSSYVEWCIESGVATEGLRLAAAAIHTAVDDIAHVLLVTDGQPTTTDIDLALGTATTSVSVAVRAIPTTPTWMAWTADSATIRDLLGQRAEVTGWGSATVVGINGTQEDRSIPVAADPPAQSALVHGDVDCHGDVYGHAVEDPVSGTVDLLDRLLDGAIDVPSEEAPEPSAICVTARPARRARRFMRLAVDQGLPVVRTGPIDVYRTRIAVLSLAWLRIIEGVRADRGWAVVLESAGCSPGDIEAWLDGDERPAVFASVRGQLKALTDGPAVIASVAERYGTDPRATHALLTDLTDGSDRLSTMATLDRLAGRSGDDRMVHLEPPPDDVTQVSIRPPETAPVILHVDGACSRSTPVIEYRPPLGAFTTRRIELVADHPVERPAPVWATASSVSADDLERRRCRAIASASRARRFAVVIGAPPCLGGVAPFDD